MKSKTLSIREARGKWGEEEAEEEIGSDLGGRSGSRGF